MGWQGVAFWVDPGLRCVVRQSRRANNNTPKQGDNMTTNNNTTKLPANIKLLDGWLHCVKTGCRLVQLPQDMDKLNDLLSGGHVLARTKATRIYLADVHITPGQEVFGWWVRVGFDKATRKQQYQKQEGALIGDHNEITLRNAGVQAVKGTTGKGSENRRYEMRPEGKEQAKPTGPAPFAPEAPLPVPVPSAPVADHELWPNSEEHGANKAKPGGWMKYRSRVTKSAGLTAKQARVLWAAYRQYMADPKGFGHDGLPAPRRLVAHLAPDAAPAPAPAAPATPAAAPAGGQTVKVSPEALRGLLAMLAATGATMTGTAQNTDGSFSVSYQ